MQAHMCDINNEDDGIKRKRNVLKVLKWKQDTVKYN
jgi:hypothetical protein